MNPKVLQMEVRRIVNDCVGLPDYAISYIVNSLLAQRDFEHANNNAIAFGQIGMQEAIEKAAASEANAIDPLTGSIGVGGLRRA